MNGKAHLAAGIATGAACAIYMGIDHTQYTQIPILLKIVSASSIGALLPDIDIEHSSINSLIKRVLLLIPFLVLAAIYFDYKITMETAIALTATILIFKFSKHRSVTHSFVGLIIIFYMLYHFLGITDLKFVIYPFMLGGISHIVLDMLTPEGVELFFPVRKHIGVFNL